MWVVAIMLGHSTLAETEGGAQVLNHFQTVPHHWSRIYFLSAQLSTKLCQDTEPHFQKCQARSARSPSLGSIRFPFAISAKWISDNLGSTTKNQWILTQAFYHVH